MTNSTGQKALRRSMLFVPGNNPAMLNAAPLFGADSVILDLEDSVSPAQKDAARVLVRECLAFLDFGAVERVVRINPVSTSGGRADLEMVIQAGVDAILLPKAELAWISALHDLIASVGADRKPPTMIALIETAKGLEEAYSCAQHPGVSGLFLGAEDLTADLDATRTKEGTEILYARSRLVCAAKAAGIDAIDTPFTDTLDDEGFVNDLRTTRNFGFTGRACIHPRQVQMVHTALSPSADEIAWAYEVREAYENATAKGLGAVAVRGKMVDPPIVARAEAIIKRALAAGLADGSKGGETR